MIQEIAIVVLFVYSVLVSLAYARCSKEFLVYRLLVQGKMLEMQTELKRMGEALKGENSEEKHL
jgi:hypothetical protein